MHIGDAAGLAAFRLQEGHGLRRRALLGCRRFGNEQVPGNLLTGFGFFEPYWLVVMANLAIVIHLFGGYQVGSC